jgi:hypothetical protein
LRISPSKDILLNDSSTTGATRALQQLERRRRLLERLIFVARSLESLKHSLENVIDQGEELSESRPEVAATFNALGHRLRNMSDAEVKLRLDNLDHKLHAQFKQIHPLIEQLEVDEGGQEARLAEAQESIEHFRRYALTALALRLLLRHRGQPVVELHLPFERATLVRQLEGLDSREKVARKQVVDEVESMAQDLDALLEKPDLPPAMHGLLEQLRNGLADNLAHLLAGKSIDSLPLALETVDFGAVPTHAAPLEPEPAPLPNQPPSTAPASTAAAPDMTPQPPPPNLLRALWLWINAPWGVTWREIRQGKKAD